VPGCLLSPSSRAAHRTVPAWWQPPLAEPWLQFSRMLGLARFLARDTLQDQLDNPVYIYHYTSMWRTVRTVEEILWRLWTGLARLAGRCWAAAWRAPWIARGWLWGGLARLLRRVVRRLGRCRSSAEERRLRAELKVVRSRLAGVAGRLALAEEDAAVEIRRLREALAEAEAQVAARTAEVEAFQAAHEHTMAMFAAHTAVLNACEAIGGMVAQPRRRA